MSLWLRRAGKERIGCGDGQPLRPRSGQRPGSDSCVSVLSRCSGWWFMRLLLFSRVSWEPLLSTLSLRLPSAGDARPSLMTSQSSSSPEVMFAFIG